MIVSSTRYHARLATCHACEFFKPNTGSCGTLLNRDEVVYNGEKYNLCGCVVKMKAWSALHSCPVDKWKNKDSVFKYIKEVKSWEFPLNDQQHQRFYEIKSDLKGKNVMLECEACANREIIDFLEFINNALDDD